MPPFETSQDMLAYALTAVVLVVGILLSWSLYYLAMTLRDTRKVTKDIRTKFDALWEIIELAKDKLQVGSTVFKVAATGIKELSEHFKAFTEKEVKKKK